MKKVCILFLHFWSNMLYFARFVCDFSDFVSGPPFYYVRWNIFGKMNVNHMKKRSSAIWQRVEGKLLYFHHRIISDPNESPSDMLSNVFLKIILSPGVAEYLMWTEFKLILGKQFTNISKVKFCSKKYTTGIFYL